MLNVVVNNLNDLSHEIHKDDYNCKTKLACILRQLMDDAKISESELARQASVPQTTINRILSGQTTDPRSQTLIALAQFFRISVEQMLGSCQISEARIVGTYNNNNRDKWSYIPIINLSEVSSYLFQYKNFSVDNHAKWIATEKQLDPKSYAVYSPSSLSPRFREGSVLIIDAVNSINEISDGSIIVIAIDGQNATLRKVIHDGDDIYLKSVSNDLPIVTFNNKMQVFGVIIECRINV